MDYVMSRKAKEMEERFKFELKRNKEAWVASEKVRRDKWEAEKKEEIKDMTIRGLMPELLK